jgi:hypothetical protein
MTEILLGPTLMDGPTTKVKDKKSGKTYYKKLILREGEFQYTPAGSTEKIKLDLSAPQLKNFVQSFKDKAYDEVPFQFGKHDNDPNIRKGTMAHCEHIPGKGVEGYFELESDAAAYVEKYPNFGVSPRLVLDIKRADGKAFAGAIQHVAGTVVPRLTGMGPWSKVELSEEGDTDSQTPVIDLSTEAITVERERKVIDVTDKKEEGGQVVTLSQEEYDFFKKMKDEYTEAERLLGESEKKTDETSKTVDLSAVTAVEKKADEALSALAQIRTSAAKDQWAAQRALLLSQGVPPAALDLAEPIMSAVETQTYDLSTPDGDVKVSAKTQMLSQLELMKGTIDLSGEMGHGMTGTDPDAPSQEDMTAWMRANGI